MLRQHFQHYCGARALMFYFCSGLHSTWKPSPHQCPRYTAVPSASAWPAVRFCLPACSCQFLLPETSSVYRCFNHFSYPARLVSGHAACRWWGEILHHYNGGCVEQSAGKVLRGAECTHPALFHSNTPQNVFVWFY